MTLIFFAICIGAPHVLLASILSQDQDRRTAPPLRRARSAANLPSDNCKSDGSDLATKNIQGSEFDEYSPPEWNSLTQKTKAKLADLLSFENLSTWDFNVVEVAELLETEAESPSPLLLVGWAILCEPMAQEAMNNSLEVEGSASGYVGEGTVSKHSSAYHYYFGTHIKINPRAICNFLREIERRYIRENPYHNNIHAADITQTLHCLFQMFGEQYLWRIYDPITIFSLLLAATFHDVGHPGTSNIFQQNARTQIAIEYGHASPLENMHSAIGRSLLLGEEVKDEWDVFEGWMNEEKEYSGQVMQKAILSTDMTRHVAITTELSSLIGQVHELADIAYRDEGDNKPQSIPSILARTIHRKESHDDDTSSDQSNAKLELNSSQLAGLMTGFLLHAADIANSAKTEDLAIYWSSRVVSEFSLQGDKEKELGLPISPLCDRDTLNIQESQINFIKFIIRPTFELLGWIIPMVNEEVRPHVDHTLEYWEQDQQKLPIVSFVQNSYLERLRDTIFGFELFAEESSYWEWIMGIFEGSRSPYWERLMDSFEESYWGRLRDGAEESPYWERLRDTVTEVLN